MLILSESFEAILITPSSFISTFAPETSTISRITFPPDPITSRILSVAIFNVSILGAYFENSPASLIDFDISSNIWILPLFACSSAFSMISGVIPATLISICKDVMPSDVPATLKSISPKWSSSPKISVKTAYSFPSKIRPIATPATADFSGTPASIIDNEAPQTVAIDDDPLDSVISETIRIVYGKSELLGSTACNARHASFPWPISRLPGPAALPVSPTE